MEVPSRGKQTNRAESSNLQQEISPLRIDALMEMLKKSGSAWWWLVRLAALPESFHHLSIDVLNKVRRMEAYFETCMS